MILSKYKDIDLEFWIFFVQKKFYALKVASKFRLIIQL